MTRLGRLLLAVLTAALSAASPLIAQSPVKLRILVPQSTSALPFLLIHSQGPTDGLEVSVEQFASHPQALALLLKGDADLLLTGTSQGWENRLDGSPLVMIDTGIWGISSLVVKDPSLKDFADLKGKRIALPFAGSPLDFQTRAILSRLSMDPDRGVTISYGPFTQSMPLLMAGQLDAVALPEPQATMMVREQGLIRAETYAGAWAKATGDPESPQVSLFATSAFASSHKAVITRLVDAWRKASAQVREKPDAAAEAFASTLSSTPEIMAEAARNTLFDVPDFKENKTRVMAYYGEVAPYFPAPRRPLDDAFFFIP